MGLHISEVSLVVWLSKYILSDTQELHVWGYNDWTAQEYSASSDNIDAWIYVPVALSYSLSFCFPLEMVSIPFHLNEAYSISNTWDYYCLTNSSALEYSHYCAHFYDLSILISIYSMCFRKLKLVLRVFCLLLLMICEFHWNIDQCPVVCSMKYRHHPICVSVLLVFKSHETEAISDVFISLHYLGQC